MARMAKVVELPSIAKIDKSKGKISAQLTQALREAVQSGDLQPGDPLPSSRELALTLGVARGTIIEAYDQLLAEGVFDSQPRTGTYVSHALIKTSVIQHSSKENKPNSISLTKSARSYAKVLDEFKPLPHVPFAVSVPVGRTQPSDIWRKFGNKYRSRGAGVPSGYGEPQGVLSLRIAIADYVRRSRSVHCEPEQIVITPGIQQSLYICSQILFEAKDEVWVEDPAYRGTTAIFEHTVQNIRMVRVPVDEEGIQVETGIKLSKHARAAFVTPSHQYPLGMPMSLARRTALLAWAKQQNAWIIEDDYDSELRYNGQPFPSLQGMAPDQVIYLGTFSKVLFPSLRLGYAVLPKELVAPFCGLRVLIDRHPPAADQHVLAAFIQEGYLERHIRRTRNVYAEVREYIIGLIEKYIPQELAWLQPGDQGMHMVLWLAQHINDIDVASSAVDAGIAIKAISPTFSKERRRSGLIVGLGDFEPELMQQAIKKLSKIIQQYAKSM
ncbi:PLP-dependent aminotransferase family protein [Acinetobacter baumannii]|jgi:GntR family transcriptional regulator/MocR family aminotransferase|uniref:MocR-like pyridoxine biosynthesis transcription factor PdxR n=1 Tax=Acinetobacter TaxID=469 RepID=UPI000707C3B7|nr:PLP-dependent aminotransferase family protein [Acinetobacter baumannii]EHU1306628.1 PLP-dependent aminotransferase family protein [Acinetobacter baumannii]EHU1427459.1 PLP-dependent aminotransferase family protein [Acinetobacter baumannii]EHU2157608.1 PLP-dependent aminotransferase family protein [Acinetobacter baumannii]EHU2441447.1 PLP-dependent aminotransferase family protein [Acinetobacter baumannii]EIB6848960.1 PLP-dependent aminotransferase family protein [Acinetobacter baumannii]